MDSEIQLIKRIHRRFRSGPLGGRNGSPTGGASLRVGIGDDAAVLRPRAGSEWVVTTDAFLENVHFLRNVHPADAVGYKAVARATSDLAAMGSGARYLFLTLGIPDSCAGEWLDGFLAGMARASRRFGLTLAGGDTTKYSTVVAALTVMGEVNRGQAALRSGAKPGDLLCVSGTLGEAELGLRLVLGKLHGRKRWSALLKKHFYPEPRLALGQWLVAHRCATAMIDTSDGLSTDLSHLCKASGVGAHVWAANLPAVKVPPELRRLGLEPLDLALNGGEDYELLFSVPKRLARRLGRKAGGVSLTVIGEITRERKIVLIAANGDRRPLAPKGWDPFRKKS